MFVTLLLVACVDHLIQGVNHVVDPEFVVKVGSDVLRAVAVVDIGEVAAGGRSEALLGGRRRTIAVERPLVIRHGLRAA